jgi:hypothetical protein
MVKWPSLLNNGISDFDAPYSGKNDDWASLLAMFSKWVEPIFATGRSFALTPRETSLRNQSI